MEGRGNCYRSLFFHGFGFSPEAFFGLWQDVRKVDVVYSNGIATFPTTLAQFYSVIQRKPFAVGTHGLTEWSYSYKALRKAVYFNLVVFPLMRKASFIRVTSAAESEFLARRGFRNHVLVQNGVSLEEFSDLPDKLVPNSFTFTFLGRMSREKGLDLLLPVYGRLLKEFPEMRLTLNLVGPDPCKYINTLKSAVPADGVVKSDGLYGVDKTKLLRDSDCLILPSYSENFGNVVAEALACETPVITTTGTPWSEIEKVGCGLYVKPEAEALYQAMKAMYLKTPEERREMGRRGREYVLKNFNWEDKARELFEHLKKLVPAEKL